MSVQSLVKLPDNNDVLFGRGSDCWAHEGNIHFRSVVSKYQDEYHSNKTRSEKADIVGTIVQEMKQIGARFLKKDPYSDGWYEANRAAIIEKVGHAIRDKQAITQRRINNQKKKQAKLQRCSHSMQRTSMSRARDSPAYSHSPLKVRSPNSLQADLRASTAFAVDPPSLVDRPRQLSFLQGSNSTATTRVSEALNIALLGETALAVALRRQREQFILEELVTLSQRRAVLEASPSLTRCSSVSSSPASLSSKFFDLQKMALRPGVFSLNGFEASIREYLNL